MEKCIIDIELTVLKPRLVVNIRTFAYDLPAQVTFKLISCASKELLFNSRHPPSPSRHCCRSRLECKQLFIREQSKSSYTDKNNTKKNRINKILPRRSYMYAHKEMNGGDDDNKDKQT